MSREIDDRIVALQFNNENFERNVATSVETLSKFEKALKLSEGTKGLENVDAAAKKVNFAPLITSLDTVKNGFSQLQVVAATVVSTITSKLMSVGNMLVNTFALAPLKSGFAEYSQKIDSTMVIMNNTGSTAKQVAVALGELNEYADKTIYSFGDMTTAIKKFAAAGVNLDDSVAAIKGLSGAAALVGADNQKLYMAFYNLAQSMQTGYLTTIDWKSILMSGIGTNKLAKNFVDTAIAMGKLDANSKIAKEAVTNLKDTLSERWLTTDIIVETLKKYADANDVNSDIGKQAMEAATKVKSFVQMWEVLTEAVGTGWADTWTSIFGDLEEAKLLWTGISDAILEVIDGLNETKKGILNTWAAMGGQEDLREALIGLAKNFSKIGASVNNAINNVFPNASEEIWRITRRFRLLVEALSMSDDGSNALTNSLELLLKSLKFIYSIIKFIVKVLASAYVIGQTIVDTIIFLIGNLNLIPQAIDDIFGNGTFGKLVESARNTLQIFGEAIVALLRVVLMAADELGPYVLPLLEKVVKLVSILREGIVILLTKLLENENVLKAFHTILNGLSVVLSYLIVALGKAIDVASKFFETLDFSSALSTISESGSSAGKDFISGLVNGLYSGFRTVANAAVSLAGTLIDAFRGPKGIDSHSPAKTAYKSGRYFGEGTVKGLDDSTPTVTKSAENLASKLVNTADDKVSGAGQKIGKKFGDDVTSGVADAEVDAESAGEKLLGYLKLIGNKMVEFVNGLTPQKVILFSFSAAIVYVVAMFGLLKMRLAEGIPNIIGQFAKLSNAVVDIAVNLKDYVKAMTKATTAKIRTDSFRSIATSILELAVAFAILATVFKNNNEGFKTAAITIGVLIGVLTALTIAFSKLGIASSNVKATFGSLLKLMGLSNLLFTFSASVLMLVGAMKMISNLNLKELGIGVAGMTAALVELVSAAAALSKWAPELSKNSIAILLYAVAVNIMVTAFVKLANTVESIDWNALSKAFATMSTIVGSLIGASIGINKLMQSATQITSVLAAITKALIVMALSVAIVVGSFVLLAKIIENTDSDAINMAKDMFIGIAVSLTLFSVAVIVMMKTLNAASENIATSMPTMMRFMAMMSILMAALTASIAVIMRSYDGSWDHFIQLALVMFLLTGFITAISLAIYGAVTAMDNIKPESIMKLQALSVVLVAISAAVIELSVGLAIVTKSFSELDSPWAAIGAVKSICLIISSILGALLILIESINRYDLDAKDIAMLGVLIGSIATSVLIMASSIAMLAKVYDSVENTGSAIGAVGSILVVMGAIAGMLFALNKYNNSFNGYDIAAISVMPMTVVPIAMSIAYLAKVFSSEKIKTGDIVASVATIGIILLAIGAMFKIIGKMSGSMNGGAVASLVIVMLMIGELVGSIIALTYFIESTRMVDMLIAVGSISAILIALGMMFRQMEKIPANLNKNFVSGLVVIMLGLVALVGSLVLLTYMVEGHTEAIAAATIIVAGIIFGISKLIDTLGKNGAKANKSEQIVKSLALFVGSLSVFALAFAGAGKILDTCDSDDIIAKLMSMVVAVGVAGGLVLAISKWGGDTGKMVAAGGAMLMIATGFSAMAMAVKLLSDSLQSANFSQVRESLIDMTVALSALGLVAMLISQAKQYALIGAGVLAVLAAGFVAMSYAVKTLDSVDLKSIADGVSYLTKTLTGANAGNTFAFIGALLLLSVALALLAPAVAIIAVSALGFAGSMYIVAQAINLATSTMLDFWNNSKLIFADILEHLELFVNAFTSACGGAFLLGNALVPLALVLPLIAGSILIISTASTIFGVAAIAFAGAMNLMATAVNACKDSLVEIISYLTSNIDSIGAAISSVLKELANTAEYSDQIKEIGEAIQAVGWGCMILAASLVVFGAGLVVSAVGVLAMAGAIKVLDIVLNSIDLDRLHDIFEYFMNYRAAIIFGLGVSLTILGGGLLASAIGLLAFTGALAVFKNVINGIAWEDLKTVLDYFLSGRAAIILGLGVALTIFGGGLLATGIGLLALSGAIAVLGNALNALRIDYYADIICTSIERISTAVADCVESIKQSAVDMIETAGYFIEGIVEVFESSDSLTTLANTAAGLGNAIIDGIRNVLEIHSPSEVAKELAEYFIKGLIIPMVQDSKVGKAASNLGSNAINGVVSKLKDNKSIMAVLDNIKGKLTGGLGAIWGQLDIGKGIEDLMNQLGLGGDAAEDFANSLGNVGSTAKEVKGTLETLTDTIKSQMKMFEKFDMATDMSAKDLLDNMESNLVGIRAWSEGIETLGYRGMSKELIQYLAEMGPQGFKYVEAFLDMTEEEFARANSMFSESLTLPDEAARTVMSGYERAGVEIVESVHSGVSSTYQKKLPEEKEEFKEGAEEVAKESAYAYVGMLNKTVTESEFQQLLSQFKDNTMRQLLLDSTSYLDQFGLPIGKTLFDAQGHNLRDMAYLTKLGQATGKFYGEGFLQGISAQEYIAKCQQKGYFLAASVDDSVAEYLEIHSPSRVGEKKGMYYVLGLVNGIKKYTNVAAYASEDLAENAVDALSASISSISDLFGEDFDTNPTITPVLDLSQVTSGAAQLNSLLSGYNASAAAVSYSSMVSGRVDPVTKMQAALDDANAKYSKDIVNAITNSNQPINLNVTLEGDAAGIFKLVESENLKATKAGGVSPLMLMYAK